MAKKIVILCAALLSSSLIYLQTVNAEKFKVLRRQVPVEVVINQEDEQNPKACILNVVNKVPVGLKYAVLPQFAVAYNPENTNGTIVLVDIKKAIIDLVAKDPELAEYAGISDQDFADAGISEAELQELRKEKLNDDEIGNAIEFIVDALFDGDVSFGINYFLDGGADLMKACGKMSLGTAILVKKAIVGIVGLARHGYTQIFQ